MHKKRIQGNVVTILLIFFLVCLILSALNYRAGNVDMAILNFGTAIFLAMCVVVSILYQKLDKRLSHLEELLKELKDINGIGANDRTE